MTRPKLKSPYSYFGAKSRVADVIWERLGQVSNYIEPFAGTLSVLLANPTIPKIETVNDISCSITNFWRAVSADPDTVAKFADYPVHEADLHARHKWLVSATTDDFLLKITTDPDYYDAKMAGYWIYGMGASIGNNWVRTSQLKSMPLLSSAGGGIHGLTYNIQEDFKKLQQRLRRVRVCCGDWKRIMSSSITFNNKSLSTSDITGVFLDPPYELKGRDKVYQEEGGIYQEVCQWALDNGDNPRLRVVVCGYDGDFTFPDTWKTYSWKSNGMANLGNDRGKDNSKKEMIYFSPNCIKYEK